MEREEGPVEGGVKGDKGASEWDCKLTCSADEDCSA